MSSPEPIHSVDAALTEQFPQQHAGAPGQVVVNCPTCEASREVRKARGEFALSQTGRSTQFAKLVHG